MKRLRLDGLDALKLLIKTTLTEPDERDLMMNVLIIEDDQSLAKALSKAFTREGFAYQICYTVAQALSELSAEWDLCILDLRLPDGSGMKLIQKIREASDLPLLVISADMKEKTILESFDRQADDYLEKPFSLSILLARARAVLRRSGGLQNALACGNAVLYENKRILEIDDQQLILTRSDCILLKIFLKNPDQILSRPRLMHALHSQSDSSLSSRICDLKRKLPDPKQIENIRHEGYRWNSSAPLQRGNE